MGFRVGRTLQFSETCPCEGIDRARVDAVSLSKWTLHHSFALKQFDGSLPKVSSNSRLCQVPRCCRRLFAELLTLIPFPALLPFCICPRNSEDRPSFQGNVAQSRLGWPSGHPRDQDVLDWMVAVRAPESLTDDTMEGEGHRAPVCLL